MNRRFVAFILLISIWLVPCYTALSHSVSNNNVYHQSWAVGELPFTLKIGGPNFEGEHRHPNGIWYEWEIRNYHKEHHGGNGNHALGGAYNDGFWHWACVEDDRGSWHRHDEAPQYLKDKGTGTHDEGCETISDPNIYGHVHSLTHDGCGNKLPGTACGIAHGWYHRGVAIYDGNGDKIEIPNMGGSGKMGTTEPHNHIIEGWDTTIIIVGDRPIYFPPNIDSTDGDGTDDTDDPDNPNVGGRSTDEVDTKTPPIVMTYEHTFPEGASFQHIPLNVDGFEYADQAFDVLGDSIAWSVASRGISGWSYYKAKRAKGSGGFVGNGIGFVTVMNEERTVELSGTLGGWTGEVQRAYHIIYLRSGGRTLVGVPIKSQYLATVGDFYKRFDGVTSVKGIDPNLEVDLTAKRISITDDWFIELEGRRRNHLLRLLPHRV